MLTLVKILLILAFMVFLMRRKFKVGNVLVAAAFFTALVYRLPPRLFLATLLQTAVEPRVVNLAGVILGIIGLSNALQEGKLLDDLIDGLQAMVPSRRLLFILLPAFIGLLPMPGGALFSAPMVERAAVDTAYDPSEKSFINYWFRHLNEYVFPLYPGFILATALLGISYKKLFLAHLPLPLLALAAGFLTILRRRPVVAAADLRPDPGAGLYRFFRALLPVALVIILSLALAVPLTIALAITLAVLFLFYRLPAAAWRQIFRRSLRVDMLVMVFGIFAFKNTLELSGAVHQVPELLLHAGIPVALVVFLVTFIVGGLLGITVAFVGICYPLLAGILVPAAGSVNLHYEMLAFVGGFVGVLLSPVHLCLVLSNEYFHADTARVYRLILAGSLLITIGVVVLYLAGWPPSRLS